VHYLTFAMIPGLPIGLVAGWVLLRRRGVPGWVFFASAAGSLLLAGLVTDIAGNAEDGGLPYACRTGAAVGLECGFGLTRFLGALGVLLGAGCLAVLGLMSLMLRPAAGPRA